MRNKEFLELDKKFAGIVPYNFAPIGSGTNNRVSSEYTWYDICFNLNDAPFKTDTAIIVTSWHGQLGWLKATLTNYRLANCFVILSYDNPFYVWENLDDTEYMLRRMLRPTHYLLAHAVVTKHKTYDADKRIGWYWDMKYAQSIVNGFPNIKYVYGTNGDCIIEKPEGIEKLKEVLGDGDFISGQSSPGGTIHTCDVFYKVEAFNKIMDYMTERMNPMILAGQSPECLLRDAVNVLGLKETFAKQPIKKDGSIDYYCTENLDSTWKEVLGFRNLYAETEFRENNGLEPLDKKYFDPFHNWCYFREDWQQTLLKYYETGDKRFLMMWWDRGKDSAEDRLFFPLEHYGQNPIY